MNSTDLVMKLAARYPSKENGPMLDDIGYVLTGLPDSAINAAWDAFRTKWQGNRCPNSGWFACELVELGFQTKKVGRDHSGIVVGAWVCADCGTHYGPLTIYACPSCGSRDTAGIGDCANPSYREMSEESEWHKSAIKKLIKERNK